MTTITLKNIPDDLYERLKLQARARFHISLVIMDRKVIDAFPDTALTPGKFLAERT